MGKVVAKSRSSKESKELTQNHQEFKNGIPVNPNCIWDYQVLANFYHQVLNREIEDMKSAAKGANARRSDLGHDGSNGIDEYFFNTQIAEAENLGKIKEDELRHKSKLKYFSKLKEQIEAGQFVCRCEYKIFYAKNIL